MIPISAEDLRLILEAADNWQDQMPHLQGRTEYDQTERALTDAKEALAEYQS